MCEMIEIQSNEPLNVGYAQFTFAEIGWTDEERESMRERDFDDMDMLSAWLA